MNLENRRARWQKDNRRRKERLINMGKYEEFVQRRKEYDRQYYLKNIEKKRLNGIRYKKEKCAFDRDFFNRKNRIWYARHKDRISLIRKKRYASWSQEEKMRRLGVSMKSSYRKKQQNRIECSSKIKEYKLKGCSNCGYNRCPESIEFHHINKDTKQDYKKDDISSMLSSGKPWERIEKEMAKCILLCSNCHRELHYNERHNLPQAIYI